MCDQICPAQFCEDDDLGGGLCHLWSSDHALLEVEIITIIIEIIVIVTVIVIVIAIVIVIVIVIVMRVTRMM